MGHYLLDHPNPNYPQTRPRTSWGWLRPTGLVTVHTAEGALDRIAPDTGAENVAGFIASRSDAGGYHVLVDTDSTIDMAPDDLMTWHTAAGNLNGPGWGISAACRSTEWDPDADWTRTIIGRMGAAIRAFWERQGHDPVASARWIPGRDVLAAGGRVVGLVHHGDVQPGDRSDAWALHPRRAELDQMLVDAITGTPAPDPAPPDPSEEDDDMPQPPLIQLASTKPGTVWGAHIGIPDPAQYAVDGLTVRWCSQADVAEYQREHADGIIRLEDIGEQRDEFFDARTLDGRKRPDGGLTS